MCGKRSGKTSPADYRSIITESIESLIRAKKEIVQVAAAIVD